MRVGWFWDLITNEIRERYMRNLELICLSELSRMKLSLLVLFISLSYWLRSALTPIEDGH